MPRRCHESNIIVCGLTFQGLWTNHKQNEMNFKDYSTYAFLPKHLASHFHFEVSPVHWFVCLLWLVKQETFVCAGAKSSTFLRFRTFRRTRNFERLKLITRTSKEDHPATGRRWAKWRTLTGQETQGDDRQACFKSLTAIFRSIKLFL